jgi:uncharacterized protein (DUF433 family)
MASTIEDIGTLITRSHGKYHGRPYIMGTGITVHRVASWYNLHHSPEEIVEHLDHLSLAQVYAALTYYHANRASIDAELANDEVEYDKREGEWLRAGEQGLIPQ